MILNLMHFFDIFLKKNIHTATLKWLPYLEEIYLCYYTHITTELCLSHEKLA